MINIQVLAHLFPDYKSHGGGSLAIGVIFQFVAIGEGILLIGAVALSVALRHVDPAWLVLLVLLGFGAAALMGGIGRVFISTSRVNTHGVVPAIVAAPRTEARTIWSLVVGVVATVLCWPLGVILGPCAFGLGFSALSRIRDFHGSLNGGGLALAGMTLGGLVTGIYLMAVVAEVAFMFAFGELIPAAP